MRSMVISAVMMALALTLPVAFHAVGLGSQFLPMLLPLLVNGFFSTTGWALLTGLLTPFVSAFLTGMPPLYPPVAVVVALEGATLGCVASLAWRLTRPRIWPALLAAVVSGRLSAVLITWFMAAKLHLPVALAAWGLLVHGLPGVALQLSVTPVVVRYLERRKGPLFAQGDPS